MKIDINTGKAPLESTSSRFSMTELDRSFNRILSRDSISEELMEDLLFDLGDFIVAYASEKQIVELKRCPVAKHLVKRVVDDGMYNDEVELSSSRKAMLNRQDIF